MAAEGLEADRVAVRGTGPVVGAEEQTVGALGDELPGRVEVVLVDRVAETEEVPAAGVHRQVGACLKQPVERRVADVEQVRAHEGDALEAVDDLQEASHELGVPGALAVLAQSLAGVESRALDLGHVPEAGHAQLLGLGEDRLPLRRFPDVGPDVAAPDLVIVKLEAHRAAVLGPPQELDVVPVGLHPGNEVEAPVGPGHLAEPLDRSGAPVDHDNLVETVGG
jgi:hypothetical protein